MLAIRLVCLFSLVAVCSYDPKGNFNVRSRPYQHQLAHHWSNEEMASVHRLEDSMALKGHTIAT